MHQHILCEGLTEVKSISGAWRADFHPHWGHHPPHTPTNGWVGNAPMTSLLSLSIWRWWFYSSHFPMLSSEQENAWFLLSPGHGTCHVHWLDCLSLYWLYQPSELPFIFTHRLSFTPLERLLFLFPGRLFLLFFSSLPLLLPHTFTRTVTPLHRNCFHVYLLLQLLTP